MSWSRVSSIFEMSNNLVSTRSINCQLHSGTGCCELQIQFAFNLSSPNDRIVLSLVDAVGLLRSTNDHDV